MRSVYPDFKGESWIDWGASVLKFVQTEILFTEGSYEKAIAILEKEPPQWLAKQYIHLLDYQQFFIMDILARAYQQGGKLDKAIEEYERLITYDPKSKDQFLLHPKYHYRLAKLYEEKGQTQSH